MSNANSSVARTRRPLLTLSVGALALALAFGTVAVPAAHAGGAAGGIVMKGGK